MAGPLSVVPHHHPHAVDPLQVKSTLLQAGEEVETWSNPPFYRWRWHTHDVAKTIYCLNGAVTFYTPQGDVALRPGDRLDLPRGLAHAASAGAAGVTCLEVVSSTAPPP